MDLTSYIVCNTDKLSLSYMYMTLEYDVIYTELSAQLW